MGKYNDLFSGPPPFPDVPCGECGTIEELDSLKEKCYRCGKIVCGHCHRPQRLCDSCWEKKYKPVAPTMQKSIWGKQLCRTCYSKVGHKCFECGRSIR